MRFRSTLVAAVLAMLLLAIPARAVIMFLLPLKDLAEKEQLVFIAKVAEVLPDKPGMVLVPIETIKGKLPFERMAVNLTGDAEAKKGKHTDMMLERIDKDVPIVIIASKTDNKYTAFGFTEGTWFQMHGIIEKTATGETIRWAFQHGEPYLRRTYKGTTAELKQIMADAVAGKKEPPAPDSKEKPGFGPPIKKASLAPAPVFPLFGVIQLPFLGLIAALAALFPAVFGGLALFMKRWVAVLSTSGIVSMVAAVPVIFPAWAAKQWIYTPAGLWLSCAFLFAAGAHWSAYRYRKSLTSADPEIMQPRRFDRRAIPLLAFAGIVSLLIGLQFATGIWMSDYWRWALAGTVGFTICAYYLLTVTGNPVRVSPETLLLLVLAVSCGIFGAWEAGRFSRQGRSLIAGGGLGVPSIDPDNAILWKWEPDLGGMVVNSFATPERIYVAVFAMPRPTSQTGRVVALDTNTGAELWTFPNAKLLAAEPDFTMKPAFSAPVYADGRVYVGEGLHQHTDSRMFCLDAATGDLLWKYQTDSHTESTPVVAEGKVVFGAGYHGIHCLDAVKGPGADNQPLWRFPKNAKAEDRALHVDANPVIANGCVYAGSGYKPEYVKQDGKVNSVFCLDLNTGEPKWQVRQEDSVYGSLLVRDGRVYHGTGNSTYSESFPSQRPGVICRDAKTGDEIWYCRLPETVLAKPAADRYQLYVGCVDGNAVAIDRATGAIAWQVKIDDAIYADPVPDISKETGLADVVYVAGKSGAVAALAPYSSNRFDWSINLNYWTNGEIEQTATPSILRDEDDSAVRHRLLLGFCQGKLGSGAARLYCLEDRAAKSAP